jgi:hypothetical protein
MTQEAAERAFNDNTVQPFSAAELAATGYVDVPEAERFTFGTHLVASALQNMVLYLPCTESPGADDEQSLCPADASSTAPWIQCCDHPILVTTGPAPRPGLVQADWLLHRC